MIRKLECLLEDASKRNDITSQTFASFRVPKFEEEKALRSKLLMLENENLRLKDQLIMLTEETSKVPKELISFKDSTSPKKGGSGYHMMTELRDTMKSENLLLRDEIKGLQRSKEATLYEIDNLQAQEEIVQLRKIIEEYRRKETKHTATYNKKTDDPDFNEKCRIVKIMNKRFDGDMQRYLFAIWRLKFLVKRTIRLKGETMAISFKNDIGGNKNPLLTNDRLLYLFIQLRGSLAKKVFEIYLRSKDYAADKKNQSFIIFRTNIEEFISNEDQMLLIVLRLYVQMIQGLGDRLPKPSRIAKLNKLAITGSNTKSMEIDDYKEVNPYGVYDGEVRDTINEWVEKNISEVQKRRKVAGKDILQKELLTLFRYLAIYYKCHYPYSNKQAYRVDGDLYDYLENLICRTLSRVVNVYEETVVVEDDDDLDY